MIGLGFYTAATPTEASSVPCIGLA